MPSSKCAAYTSSSGGAAVGIASLVEPLRSTVSGVGATEITAEVAAYHQQLTERIADLVVRETGQADAQLADQILALFEGATTAATYRGAAVIEAARTCACQLVNARARP